jgi:hypothetical protein
VRAKAIPWIQTIAVLGELNQSSEGGGNGNGVFVIQAPSNGQYEGQIRITGDPVLTGGGSSALSAAGTNKRVLYIANSKNEIIFDAIEISGGNVGSDYGGGMFVSRSKVTFNSGIIRNNTAQFGGGVWVEGAATSSNSIVPKTAVFTMTGGSITNNTATNAGGGINVKFPEAHFAMTGGTISNNNSQGSNHPCGGVRVEYSATADITGGVIRDNQVSNARTRNGDGGSSGLTSQRIYINVPPYPVTTLTGETFITANIP